MTAPPAQRLRPEVSGQSLLGVARGLSGTGVPWSEVLDLLHSVGIDQPQPEGWYLFDNYLSFLRKVEFQHGRPALRTMGRAIPDTSRFPPDLDSLEQVLGRLDVAYQVNHRGGFIGHYQCLLSGPGSAEMVCANPYPCDLDAGILERLVERFGSGAPGSGVTHLTEAACRRKGAPACRFVLRW